MLIKVKGSALELLEIMLEETTSEAPTIAEVKDNTIITTCIFTVKVILILVIMYLDIVLLYLIIFMHLLLLLSMVCLLSRIEIQCK